ncbi:hypothetical protein A8L45_16205 [Veronia pacifica]|uniref:Uncharacterized protein n=1 Tax=Veronia pacifica TaxID=1080227 RepID=A0A1C3EED5_9GAMM|nr:hypothetical protein A8L45_16205 [Veronia pacifica]
MNYRYMDKGTGRQLYILFNDISMLYRVGERGVCFLIAFCSFRKQILKKNKNITLALQILCANWFTGYALVKNTVFTDVNKSIHLTICQ